MDSLDFILARMRLKVHFRGLWDNIMRTRTYIFSGHAIHVMGYVGMHRTEAPIPLFQASIKVSTSRADFVRLQKQYDPR